MTVSKRGMRSKERVLTAFSNQEPDRIPINYIGNSGIQSSLIKYYGLEADDYEGLLKALGVDFRGVGATYRGPRLHKEISGKRVDPEWGIRTRWIEHQSGGYWDYCDFPLKDADEEGIASWPMPSPDDYDYSVIPDLCKQNDMYAVFFGGPGLGDIINKNGMLRTMEQTLVDLVTNDPVGLMLVDRRLEIQLEITYRVLEKAKGKIDFIWMGEDLGTQHSQMISLELYRNIIKPRQKKFVDLAKSFNLPVMIHSCGSSSWAFEDFIEIGINVVDTIQPEAKDMSPDYLKKKFGGRLAFHGGISTAGPVAYGSVNEVIKNIKEILEIMMPGGGYCFAPTHALQDNSPIKNVIAMYEAAHQFGLYK